MNNLIFISIFLIVLFIYLHVFFHLKTSNDMEIYDIDTPSKDKLEEICDLRQPMTFKFFDSEILQELSLTNIINKYSASHVNVRNINNQDDDLYIPLSLKETIDLLKNDNNNEYISLNNSDFITDTKLDKLLSNNESFFKPVMMSSKRYDIIIGSVNSRTPLVHNIDYRNYYLVTEGNVSIKLITPNSKQYLHNVNDYINYEFRSPINPWNPQDNYVSDFNKANTLEVNLKKGDIIFIPAYWWYSIRFNEMSSICVFNYKTYMNTLSTLPYLFMYYLQKTNIKHKIVKVKENVIKSKNEIEESEEGSQEVQPDNVVDISLNETKLNE